MTSFVGVLATWVLAASTVAAPQGSAVKVRELRSLAYLPQESVLAWSGRFDSLGSLWEGLLTLAGRVAPDVHLEEHLKPLRDWESAVGVDLRGDLLDRLGGEVALAVSLESIDQVAAAVGQVAADATPDLSSLPLAIT